MLNEAKKQEGNLGNDTAFIIRLFIYENTVLIHLVVRFRGLACLLAQVIVWKKRWMFCSALNSQDTEFLRLSKTRAS